MEQQKTEGIRNLGAFLLVCSTFGIFTGFLMAMSGGKPSLVDTFMRYFFIFTPISYFIGSLGLSRLKNWARLLTIINASILSLVFSIAIFSDFKGSSSEGVVFPLVFWLVITTPSCLIIYYLTRPKIKEQFS